MEPLAFQRFAVDLLRADASGAAWVRSFEGGAGERDGGWDAELRGTYRGLTGLVRVEVKRTSDLQGTRRALTSYIERYPTGPLLLLTSAKLTKQGVDELEGLGVGRDIRVINGGDLVSIARSHAYVTRAHGLSASIDDGVLPLEAWRMGARDEDLARLASEHSAVESAWVPIAGHDVLLLAEPMADADRVLATLGHRLARQGSPDNISAVWLRPNADPQSCARTVNEMMSLGRPLRFLVPAGIDGSTLKQLMSTPLARLVVVGDHPIEVTRRFRSSGRDPIRVSVSKPTRREILAWVQTRATGTDSVLLQEAILGLVRPDLVDLWRKAWDLVIAWLADEMGERPRTLTAAAVVAALGELSSDDVAPIALSLGEAEAVFRADLEDGVARRVLRHEHGSYAPLGEWLEDALLLAALGVSRQTDSDVLRALSAVPQERRHSAIARLARLNRGVHGSKAPAEVAAQVIGAMSLDERRHARRTAPAAFIASESLYRAALHDAGADLADFTGRSAARQLAQMVQRHPTCVLEAWGLAERLGDSGVQMAGSDGIEALVGSIVDPASVPAVRAVELLKNAKAQLETAPSPLVAGMACKAAVLWTAGNVQSQEYFRTAVRISSRTWNLRSVAVQEAFSAAGDIIRSLLESPLPTIRDQGWAALRSFGQIRGPGGGNLPDALAAVGLSVLQSAIARLSTLSSWPDKAVGEVTLVSLIGRPWSDPLVADVLESLSRDPAYLMFRATWWPENLILDLSSAAQMRGKMSARELWSWIVSSRRRDQQEGEAALVARLAATAPDTSVLESILSAGDELRRRSDSVRGWTNAGPMRIWAEMQPDVFRPLVLGRKWTSLAPEARRLLAWAATGAFSDQLQDVDGPAAGLRLDLARFLRRPGGTKAPEALVLLSALRQVTPRRNLAATLFRVARHPDATVQEEVWSWLVTASRSAPLDPRDIEAVARQLLSGSGALELVGVIARSLDEGEAVWGGAGDGTAEEILLDALERRLAAAAANGSHASLSGNLGWSLRTALTRLALRRPDRWWAVVPPFVGAGGEHDAEDFLDGVSEEGRVALLRAAPSRVEVYGAASNALDFLVRQISPARLALEAEVMWPRDPERVRTWLIAAELHPALLSPTKRLLCSLDVDDARMFVHSAGLGFGNSGGRVGPVISTSLFDDSPEAPPGDAVADAYETEGSRSGGLVGDHLREMARLRRGDYSRMSED